jgi:hypothetical protein
MTLTLGFYVREVFTATSDKWVKKLDSLTLKHQTRLERLANDKQSRKL